MGKPISEGERFIDPSTRKIYVVTALLLDGDYVVLKEVDRDNQILITREELKAWESEEENCQSRG